VLLLGAGAVALLRRRRSPSRAELVDAIAELDLQRETGDLQYKEWAARRAELKRRLSRLTGAP
jgi:hypothetical protein